MASSSCNENGVTTLSSYQCWTQCGKCLRKKSQLEKLNSGAPAVKFHDEESRLKRATKRKEKEKSKSKMNYFVFGFFFSPNPPSRYFLPTASKDEKLEQLTAAMAAGQKKRNDHIAMRNERKNDKNKGSSKKARPGFEGRV